MTASVGHFRVCFAALGVAGLLLAADAAAAVRSTGDASVTFDAIGPAGMKIRGTGSQLSVTEKDGRITATVPLSSMATGIALRDRHMKEKYLEVHKYPNATLTVARNAITFPVPGNASNGAAAGTMRIHGVSKPVTFSYSARERGGVISVSGSAAININDFGIKTPSYLGVSVKPGITLKATFAVSDR